MECSRGVRSGALGFAMLGIVVAVAHAGGPRFVGGSNAGPWHGVARGFDISQIAYYTDPGALAANVTHAQADAMVAAAAAVWNVPMVSITLTQGGTLAEHVSSGNTYFDGTKMVFPADVQATNYAAMPIAVVYDSDGSVTDLLLGVGASSPSSCRQNGVTESVDGFGGDASIQHAVILLNGRCVGSTPQQLMQMRYQLMRAFGRVLGLGWSQNNDNVFTGVPTPTADNEAYWPVMHPIDVICGPYTYQCMQNAFQLRPDDISALALLYPVTSANLTAGKMLTLDGADSIWGELDFPTSQGMQMVNMTVKRMLASTSYMDTSQIASGLSGIRYAQNLGNPVTGGEPEQDNVGLLWPGLDGLYYIPRVPANNGANLYVSAESVNPLYTGDYALGPFQRPPLTMSGTSQTALSPVAWIGGTYIFAPTMLNAASSCAPGNDGTPASPAASDPSGWWLGQICGPQHASWWSASAQAGRSWTFEVTALDESGTATNNKLQTVLGAWNMSDPQGTAPTIAAAPYAMNALAPGVTQLKIGPAGSAASLRFVVADQFGAGRPDFAYKARVLYADAIAPASVGSGGGLITLTGTGFQQGNRVLVNGVAATVTSASATQIVAIAPNAMKAGAVAGKALDVEVLDARTGANTTIYAALTYTSAADRMQLVSAPAAIETGVAAAPPFAVRVLTSDGLAPAIGATVRFSVTSGTATLGCGNSTCNVVTGTNGQAQTTITGGAAGTVTVVATEVSGGAFVQATLTDSDPVLAVSIASPPAYLAAGASATWTVTLLASRDGAAAVGTRVSWSTNSALTVSPAQGTTGLDGSSTATVKAQSIGASTNVVSGCAWTTVCATWTAYGVAPEQWVIAAGSGAWQSVQQSAMLAPVTLLVTDGAGHALPGASVTVYQSVDAWEGACPARGRCAAAPVIAKSQTTSISDGNGQIAVTPLIVRGQPQTINVAAVTGTRGFVAFSMTMTP